MPTKEKSLKYFGINLPELASRTNKCIPHLITKCTNIILQKGTDVEGIFRINGNTKIVEKIRQTYDRHGDADLSNFDDIISIACLLKLFLRDLPSSLISDEITKKFISIQEAPMTDSKHFFMKLKEALGTLNVFNYVTLKYLIAFLVLFSMRNETTKMTATALSTIFGPNIFRTSPGYIGLKEQGITNYITLQFIQKYDQIFLFDSESSLLDPSFALDKLEKYLELHVNSKVHENFDNQNVDETYLIKNNLEEEHEERRMAKNKIINQAINTIISKFIFLEEDDEENLENDYEIEMINDGKILNNIYTSQEKDVSPFEDDIFTVNNLKSGKGTNLDTYRSNDVRDIKINSDVYLVKNLSPRTKQKASDKFDVVANDYQEEDRIFQIENTLTLLLNSLGDKRRQAGRPDNPEIMSRNELADEKLCVQKALLKFENMHGRPDNEEIKNVMLPLYDYYRTIKRIINNIPQTIKTSSVSGNGSQIPPLAYTNHERFDIINNYETSENLEANFDKLSFSQLYSEFEKTHLEKKRLQIELHEFEENFRTLNGRKIQKMDQLMKESEYKAYRKVKAKLKLLEIFLKKSQKQ